MRELLQKFADWLRRDRLDAELQDELRFHREQLERDARAAGASLHDAEWSARRKLGSTTRVTEQARNVWTVRWLDHLQQDVRYALRGLRRTPGFAATVIVTLALGIGANVAIFGVIDRLMFRPPARLRDAGSVDRVYLRIGVWQQEFGYTTIPYTRYTDLAKFSTTLQDHAAYTISVRGVGSGVAARPRTIAGVTPGFFGFFDMQAERGRFLVDGDNAIPSGSNVAVVSHDYWQADLGGADVVGTPLQVGSARYTIVGVAPRGFSGMDDLDPPAVYVPITSFAWNESPWARSDYFTGYNWDWVQMVARRKPGVTRTQATADLTRAFHLSWDASRVVHPFYGPWDSHTFLAVAGSIRAAAGPHIGLEARTLLWITGVAGIVFLIACANVANLLLARAMRRRREIALRLALGVSRGRLAAQAFVETLLLAVLGAAAGVALAQWGGGWLRRVFLSNAAVDTATDWRTLGVAFAAAVVAAIAVGLAPVLFAGRHDMARTLKAGAREGTYQRSTARAGLMIAQSALSVALLIGSGLFVRSLSHVRDLRLGYDLDRLLVVRWDARGPELDSATDLAVRRRVLATALERSEVEHGAWVANPVFDAGTSTLILSIPGIDSTLTLGRFTFQTGTWDYFATMGTRILRGRGFTESDGANAERVVVLSRAMAERLWPGQEALGRCIKVTWRSPRADTMPCTTVVGIAENALHDPAADFPMRYYLPEEQIGIGSHTLLLRMRGDPAASADAVRRALQTVVPGEGLVSTRVARDLMDLKRRSWTVGAAMFGAFGALALIVAAIGLYGVITYNVAQRMHEMGVRAALGARTADIMQLVMTQGVRLAVTGVAIGASAALFAARWIQPLLFEQSARDPVVFGGVATLLIGVAALASGVPAFRASRADPSVVLRSD